MTWSRKRTLIAGIALIAISNVVALLGVWYNRNGEPESELHLTQRELATPYWRGMDRESGGLELRLQWRILSQNSDDYLYSGGGGHPEWLDKAKLEALGFHMSRQNEPIGQRHQGKQLSRQVFVALEFDGPAYQEALKRAQQLAEGKATKKAPYPNSASPEERLKREQTSASRLFAVDAALDPAELRNNFSDRSRYAIVRGRVRLNYFAWRITGSEQELGYLSEIVNDRLNVPYEFRPVFENMSRTRNWQEISGLPFHVTVAFGKRFEPWIVDASNAGK